MCGCEASRVNRGKAGDIASACAVIAWHPPHRTGGMVHEASMNRVAKAKKKGRPSRPEKGAARMRASLDVANSDLASVSFNPATPPRRGGLNIGRGGQTRSQPSFAAIDS